MRRTLHPARLSPPAEAPAAFRLWLSALLCACNAGAAQEGSVGFDDARAFEHLKAQVAFGPRHPGSPASESTRQYIERELREAGLVVVREPFTAEETPVGPVEMCNLYADLAPARDGANAPLVLLVSHYDTKRLGEKFVGANDGASSTAVLIELARSLAKKPPQDLALRILFVDGEEAFRHDWEGLDNTYGSRYHAAKLNADPALAARAKACVLLDMVGDKDLALSVDTYSTRALRELFWQTACENGLAEIAGTSQHAIKDDHLSFRKYNMEAIDLIDFDYPYWHTDEDTLDKCSQASLAKIGKLVLYTMPKLAERYAAR